MSSTITPRVLAAAIVLAITASPCAAQMDFTPRPLGRLAAGEFSLQDLPQGYSHVVMIAWPRLTSESTDKAPSTAAKFAQLFGSVMLADVRRDPGTGKHRLTRVAIGHAMRQGDQTMLVTRKSEELTFLASQVLSTGEKELDKVRQIARYDTALLFETPAVMRRGDQHQEMALRHFIWTSARYGGLASVMWLLDTSQPGAPRVADAYFVQTPHGFTDDRVLSVDPEQFNMLGVPGRTAFALDHLPRGTQISFTPELARLAAVPRYTAETLPLLAKELGQAVAAGTRTSKTTAAEHR